MDAWVVISIAGLAWLALIALSRWLWAVRVRHGEIDGAIAIRVIQLYARRMHHVRVEGGENIPEHAQGPLIVLANHTCGADPLLVQAVLDFEPRWMMADDMRRAVLDPFLEFARIIFVDRTRPDPRSLRRALEHLRAGGILGLFPEGFIERPARHLLPFQAGIGLLIKKTGAAVLPVIVDGTPEGVSAIAGLLRPSHARLRFLPVVRYDKSDLGPEQIAADLHGRFRDATSWPDAPRTPIVTPTRIITLGVDGGYVDERGEPVSDEDAAAIAAGK